MINLRSVTLKFKKSSTISLFIFLGLFGFGVVTDGYVASSTNYRIERDSINFGGGFSTSTNYIIRDTLGEVATGDSSSDSYILYAGYRQPLTEYYVSISLADDLALSNISGLLDGTTSGSRDWLVTTNNPIGYSLAIRASTNPAMTGALDNFADYSPVGVVPDFEFTVGNGEAVFGISPNGADVITYFRDESGVCGTGTGNTLSRCWDGLSTSNLTISSSNGSNHPDGEETEVEFQAGIGVGKIMPAGSYQANVTLTATAN